MPDIEPQGSINPTPEQVESAWANMGKPQAEPVKEPEKATEPVEPSEPTKEPSEPTESQEPKEPPKEPDYSQVIKFKENNQEVELTLAEIIDRAQKGTNYERKMQELATQRKAFELALQNQPKPEVKPAEQLDNDHKNAVARAMQKLGITDPNEFTPDPTGLIGNQVHFLAYQRALQEIESEHNTQQAQMKEWDTQEQRFNDVVTSVTADKNYQQISELALKSLFKLPEKGPGGIAEFNQLYPVYLKIQQREAWRQGQQIKIDPFTAAENEMFSKYIDSVKKEFYAKQFTPKTVDKKTPTQTESPGSGEAPPTKAFDFKAFSKADIQTQEAVYEAFFNASNKKG